MSDEDEYEVLSPNAGLGVNMLAGALAGITEHSVMFPVDSIKTRMQVFATSPAAVYTGIGNAFTRISSTEGVRALWRGVSSVIVGAGPAHAVHFGTYEAIKELTGGNREGNAAPWLSAPLAGASATIASDALMNPFDVIKQRMQMHQSEFRSIVTCASTVFRKEGIAAFYVSYPTTLTMTVPFTAAQFTVYEHVKKFMNPRGDYSPLSHIVAGGVAGGVAAGLTTPLDVAKTLLQTRGTSTEPEIRYCRGMLDAIRIIWRRDGLRGFSRGLSPRVVTHMPSNALCWLSYEFFSAGNDAYIPAYLTAVEILYCNGGVVPLTSSIEYTSSSANKFVMPVTRVLVDQIRQIIPPLNGKLHKGQSGRVGVLGGALDYTGAPFFAAISAQRVGVDLSHVICAPTAANAIKSYSPDLIVHPILREETPTDSLRLELAALLSRLHVLVIGPGLGREEYMQTFACLALDIAKEQGMFLVIDADGLFMVARQLDLVRGYRRAVLTPNVVEFKRLSEQVGIDPNTPPEERASSVSKALGGVAILQKGESDIIAVNTEGAESREVHEASKISPHEGEQKEVVVVQTPGGMKRCGGQGDILSGGVGAFLAWAKCYESGAFGDKTIPVSRMPILAAVGASMVTRTTSRLAFEKEGRAVVTQDMLKEIGGAFAEVFGSAHQGGKL